jgi:hypothetical protein
MQDEDYLQSLADAKSRASLRNPCTWALEQSIREHEQDEPEVFRRYFTDEDFNDSLFDYVLRQSWANRQEKGINEQEQPNQEAILTEPTPGPEDTAGDLKTVEPPAEGSINEQETVIPPAGKPAADSPSPTVVVMETPSNPPPVFFINWEQAQADFDLTLYNDRNVIGYDVNGVKHALGRIGSLTYVTSTGMVLGGNDVPGDIYMQIQAYNDGEVSDAQVR